MTALPIKTDNNQIFQETAEMKPNLIPMMKKVEFDTHLDSCSQSGLADRSGIQILKRTLDFILAVVGLSLFLPVMIVVAILIKLTSKGPVLFFQQRVGLNGKPFNIVKFRSMVTNAEAKTGAVWAEEGKGKSDPRTTPIGNILRKTHLDELPQLFLVLSGIMSFVGPRPERPEFVSELNSLFGYYNERYSTLKPGITGIAQAYREIDPLFFVSNAPRTMKSERKLIFSQKSLNETNEKLIFDHTYAIKMHSLNTLDFLMMDIKIILLTVLNIMKKMGQDSKIMKQQLTTVSSLDVNN